MSEAPETIWIQTSHIKDHCDLDEWDEEPDACEADQFTEYRRASIPPTSAQIMTAEQRGFVKGLEAAVEQIKSMKATEGVLCQRTLNLVASGLSISATKALAAIKEPKP